MKFYLKLSAMILVFSIVLYSTAIGQTAEKAEQSQETKYTIENCVTLFDINKVDSTKVGWQFWFVDKRFADGFTLKMSEVEAGKATHPPHVHQEDEIFYVGEGQAEFILGDEHVTAGPNTSFYCPSNVSHGIRNVGDGVLKYLVIKTYLNVK